nr:PREDICTED: uncharacterized protein LOC109044580 isoform X1 [Bemisia tabaci]
MIYKRSKISKKDPQAVFVLIPQERDPYYVFINSGVKPHFCQRLSTLEIIKMSERRTVLSRPRTKVYNCNYDIGERHYKSMIDELDRKYGTSSTGAPPPTPPAPVSDRFRDEDALLRTRAKTQSALEDFENLIDERRAKFDRASSSRSSFDDFDNEVSASLKRLRAQKARLNKEASLESEFESTFNNRINGSKLKLSEKLLDSVGINGRMQEALDDEIFTKRRTTAASTFDDALEEPLTKWTALKLTEADDESLAARARAKQSKARLTDLDAEIEQLAERGAARERRAQDLRALLAENDLLSEESIKVSKKFSNKKVAF